MPPRHGKSEICSFWTPTWFLTNWPDKNIILASYEADFAAHWGRRVRSNVEENGGEIDIALSKDSSAANRWALVQGGGMICAGVGGPITGRGADLLIIDDPVKNADEVASATMREKAHEWYKSTARTRLEPGGSIIIIMTRWHEDDLVGRLLEDDEEGDYPEDWDVINFPAIAEENDALDREEGEPLWSERYPIKALNRLRSSVGSYFWAAMFQQRPSPYGGGMLRGEWFEIVGQAPAKARKVRRWDLASTEERKKGNQPDWTCGPLVSVHEGIFYIEDMRRVRATPLGVEKLVGQSAALDGLGVMIRMEQEPGSSGVNTIDHYQREILLGYNFQGFRATGPKIERVRPLAAAAEAGNVKLVRGAWNQDFISEAESFPQGTFDDQIDAVASAIQDLTDTNFISPWDKHGLDDADTPPPGEAAAVLREVF